MNRLCIAAFFLLLLGCCQETVNSADSTQSATRDTIPLYAQALLEAYPDCIVGFANDSLIFADGSRMVFDDGVERSWLEMYDYCDVEDMSRLIYCDSVTDFCDPGRIRCEMLFKKMYGSTSQEVSNSTATIVWCPNIIGKKFPMNKVNHVDEQLQKVSNELDRHPEWKDYLQCSGTFNWRVVVGTNRMSPHCYAIAIDIGISKSNYWRWDNSNASETDTIRYHNSMLKEIVDIFEKYGFIWGGFWYHYDTMHFEYRPDLIIYRNMVRG